MGKRRASSIQDEIKRLIYSAQWKSRYKLNRCARCLAALACVILSRYIAQIAGYTQSATGDAAPGAHF
jgi:hypothetical protein